MAHPFEFGNRQSENAAKLAVYDRLANADAKQSAAAEKSAIDQKKMEFEQNFKLAEAQRKADEFKAASEMHKAHYEALGAMKDQRLAQFDQQLAIERAKADLDATAKAAKADTTLKVLEQAKNFLSDARGMDPSSPKFDQQYQNLAAAYPMAFEHPSVKEWSAYHIPLRQKFVAQEIAQSKTSPEKLGTTTTVTNPETGVTQRVTVPNTPKTALQQQHDALVAKMAKGASFFSGVPKPEDVAAVNAVKQKLGYDLLDTATGQPVTKPVATATAAPYEIGDIAQPESLSPASHTPSDATTPDVIPVGPTGKEVIVKDGKSYEVDHDTKSVRPL